jgi:hypothetical protein
VNAKAQAVAELGANVSFAGCTMTASNRPTNDVCETTGNW